MAARLTDKQKKKIIADYLEHESISAAARMNSVARTTVKRIISNDTEVSRKVHHKKEQNTADIIAYMDSQRELVCEIIRNGLKALSDPAKLAEASPVQITTAIGTLIDKFTNFTRTEQEVVEDDGLLDAINTQTEDLFMDGDDSEMVESEEDE